MKLLTREVMKALPLLYTKDGEGMEATAVVKFFTPWTSWTWFATEATATMTDGTEKVLADVRDWQLVEDVTFFGLVEGHETELGYFSLNELHALKGPFGLKIERDTSFRPTKLSALKRAA